MHQLHVTRTICETQNSIQPLTFMMCAMAFTIIPNPHPPAVACAWIWSNRMKWTICVWLAVRVCFNYKSLFIAATAVERLWRWRHDATQNKRVRCNILFCRFFHVFSSVLCRHDLLVYGFFALPFAVRHYHAVPDFLFSSKCSRAQIRFHFIRLLDALSPVADTFFCFVALFTPFLLLAISLLFGICLA